MKIKYIVKIVFTMFLAFLVSNCAYNEDVIEELTLDREFAPVDLVARVRNQTNVELNWDANDNAENYVVEISADDPNYTSIFLTQVVGANELPILIQLEGLTEYSIRVKAISNRGLNDSTWAETTATTLSEQILLEFMLGDIGYNQVTFRWGAGLNVTHFILQPGDVRHDVTAQEKADGIAIVSGLIGETDYGATLFNNDKIRGVAAFTTEVDPAIGTVIGTSDDLLTMIANAAPGEILLLEPGDYTSQFGAVMVNKSITIRGLLSYDKPLLRLRFNLVDGATDVALIDLDLTGDVASGLTDVIDFAGAGNYNSLLISGCNIHDYDKSLIKGQTSGAILQSLIIENSIVSNILTNSSDFIDFRTSDVLNLTIKSSTFNNCAPSRDFLRLDNAGTSNDTGLTINVLIDSCTLYACSNKDDRRILYVRFVSNDIIVRNTLIAETDSEGYADRDGIDTSPTFSNNNYFNAPTFYDEAVHTYDGTTTYTTLDPGFVDAANGNFTVTNQTLLDNAVGDPRWLQ